jgi:hypothetical protein
MAGTQRGRHTRLALKRGAIGIVSDPHVASELLTNPSSPLLIALTSWIAVHGYVSRSKGCGGRQQHQSCNHALEGLPHIRLRKRSPAQNGSGAD